MTNANLSYFYKAYAFNDVTASNAPIRKAWDWSRTITNFPLANPKSQSLILDPSATQLVFSSARSTSIDNTTSFTLTVSPVDSSLYRFTWNSTGTAPAFRVARSLSLSGQSVTFTRNTNSTATVSTTGSFAGILVGDTVFIPGVSTGDSAGPFSTLNEGFWVVLAIPSSTLVLGRLPTATFSAATETVSLTTNNQFTAFGPTGVQVGDQVQISAGFSAPVLGTYTVFAVTPTWFEVVSSTPLPLQTAVPTSTGMLFYSSAKKYLRVESDQPVVLQLNGSISTTTPAIAPLSPGDPELVGWFELVGTTFSLTLINQSLVPANIVVLSGE